MKKKFVAGIAFLSALFIVSCSNEQDAADTSEATSQTSQAQEEITATVEI